MKNYYQTLGVLDNAEDIVIRAAYKALAQRYHPDKWTGDPAEATRRMAEINEAYGVLSDPAKRRAYDEQINSQQDVGDAESGSAFEADYTSEEDEAWAMATDFFPGISQAFEELTKVSQVLANTFRLYLLESKDYSNAKKIKEKLETEYLVKFYGENEYVRAYAKNLLLAGHTKAAVELNKIVRYMGRSVDMNKILTRIRSKFPETSGVGALSRSSYWVPFT